MCVQNCERREHFIRCVSAGIQSQKKKKMTTSIYTNTKRMHTLSHTSQSQTHAQVEICAYIFSHIHITLRV